MPSYTLLVQRAEQPPEILTFEQPLVVIGRDAGDVVMHDGQISGRHAEIAFEQGKVVYKDLGSTNGSFRADGQRLFSPVELTRGQVVKLGLSTLTVQAIDNGMQGGRTILAGGPPPPGGEAQSPRRGTLMMAPGHVPSRPGGLPPPPSPKAGGKAPPRVGVGSTASAAPDAPAPHMPPTPGEEPPVPKPPPAPDLPPP